MPRLFQAQDSTYQKRGTTIDQCGFCAFFVFSKQNRGTRRRLFCRGRQRGRRPPSLAPRPFFMDILATRQILPSGLPIAHTHTPANSAKETNTASKWRADNLSLSLLMLLFCSHAAPSFFRAGALLDCPRQPADSLAAFFFFFFLPLCHKSGAKLDWILPVRAKNASPNGVFRFLSVSPLSPTVLVAPTCRRGCFFVYGIVFFFLCMEKHESRRCGGVR